MHLSLREDIHSFILKKKNYLDFFTMNSVEVVFLHLDHVALPAEASLSPPQPALSRLSSFSLRPDISPVYDIFPP